MAITGARRNGSEDVDIDERLSEAIEARRAELGLTASAFSRVTGLSQPGLAPLRKGVRRNYSADLRWQVCRVFGWTPDSIDRLMAGESPIMNGQGPDLRPPDSADHPSPASIEARVLALEQRLTVVATELEQVAKQLEGQKGQSGNQPPPAP